MGKCLITKLNGSVSNDKLPKLGEMRFYFKKEDRYSNVLNHGIYLTFAENTTISVVGGNFVDKTDSSNLGTTLSFDAGVPKSVFVSNENCYISVNKYLLLGINPISGETKSVCYFSIDDLKYSSKINKIYSYSSQVTGDIANLKNLTALTYLNLSDSQVTGDIANLKNLTSLTNLSLSNTSVSGDIAAVKNLTALTNINFHNSQQVTGDIANLKNLTALTSIDFYNSQQVTGDIANLHNLTALTYLNFYNSQVTGDIANLKNLTALTYLNFYNSQVTGDIANLHNLTALININLSDSQVTGDIAAFTNMSELKELRLNVQTSLVLGELSSLPTNLLFFSANKANKFTWNNTRSISYSIFAMENVVLSESVDKALNDLASCTNKNTDSNPSWYKLIKIIGTRTSASDTSVQTLQNKGYTVSITPA